AGRARWRVATFSLSTSPLCSGTERKETMKKRHLTATIALAATAALGLTACGNTANENGGGSEAGDSKGTITLGFLPSWTDGLSTAYLLEDQLGKLGYDVKMQELTEASVLYTGL